MTDTITNTHNDDVAGHRTGTLEHVDPHALVLDKNVREDAAIDAEFVANIKEHGVLIPIAGFRDADGNIVVRMGQRRTLAAREAGVSSVPVYVRPLAEDDTAQLVARVAEQIVENDHRRALTESQRVRGIQQLLGAGVSVTKVAQKLSVKKDTIKAAVAVGNSAAATTALDTGQLSLAEAAALTEFEDLPDAVQRLTAVAGTPRFDHVVAQLRQQQASQRAQVEAEKVWREKGFTVLDERPRSWDINCVELCYLRTADGALIDEDSVSDPARWAVLVDEDDALVDVETGDNIEESSVDWTTEHDPDATPAEGKRHANTVKDAVVHVPIYYCLDYRSAGFTLDARFLRFAGVASTSSQGSAADLVNHGGDEQDAAPDRAAALAEAKDAEAQRRERKKVIALNRLGEAATQVRREYVTKLLARKTPPKGASIFIADCLIREPALINDYHAATVTAELLGATEGDGLRQLVTSLPPTGDGRAQVLTLAVVLGALEGRTLKDAWRSGGNTVWRYNVGTGDYLAFLQNNGYQIADVERVITGERTSDDLYEQTLTAGAAADTSDSGATGADPENNPSADPE